MIDLDVGMFWTIGYKYDEGKDLQDRFMQDNACEMHSNKRMHITCVRLASKNLRAAMENN